MSHLHKLPVIEIWIDASRPRTKAERRERKPVTAALICALASNVEHLFDIVELFESIAPDKAATLSDIDGLLQQVAMEIVKLRGEREA